MTKRTIQLTNEKFQEIYTDQKLCSEVAGAHWCCRSDGERIHQITCSYPITYIVSDMQISYAKKQMEETKASFLKSQELDNKMVFVMMGMHLPDDRHGDIETGRIRGNLKNSMGQFVLLELCYSAHGYGIVGHSVIEGRDTGRNQRMCNNWNKKEVLKYVNDTYGCNFDGIVIDQFNIAPHEYVSKCRRELKSSE